MGANLDLSGPTTMTPLMWSSIRGHEDMSMYLIKRGAVPQTESKFGIDNVNEGLNALDYAIIYNRYPLALKLSSIEKMELKNPDFYTEKSQTMKVQKYDYNLMVEHLHEKCEPNLVPTFSLKSEAQTLVDPVIDPRETWTQFFKRVLEFEEPPLVEREDLPPELQPQNRAFGKMSMYLEGLESNKNIKRQDVQEERKLTSQDISLGGDNSRNIKLQADIQDIEMMVEEKKE